MLVGCCSPPPVWPAVDRSRAVARAGSRAARSRSRSAPSCCSPANYVVARQHRLDAGRLRAVVRPHAAGRHRQRAISTTHCPDAAFAALCATATSCRATPTCSSGAARVFNKLGRFAGLGKEMETHRARRPRRISAAAAQVCRRTTRAATHRRAHRRRRRSNALWHTYGIIKDDLPQLVPAMNAARQQERPDGSPTSFRRSTRFHYPVALAAMALLPLIVLLALGAAALRLWRTGGGVHRRAPRQCFRLRRAVQPARPLRRAYGLAGGLHSRPGAGARIRAPAPAARPAGAWRRAAILLRTSNQLVMAGHRPSKTGVNVLMCATHVFPGGLQSRGCPAQGRA